MVILSKKQNLSINASTQKKETKQLDFNLRPRKLIDFVGQEKIKQSLDIFIGAAQQRKETIEHILFHSQPGLGKTTLAHIIAFETKVDIHITSGPAIERAGDLVAILTNLNPGDILFIDEIHRLNRTVEEILYPAMEDYAIDLIVGKGPSARTLRLDLPKFTLIGATTHLNLLSPPFRDRFAISYQLKPYQQANLEKIIKRSAKLLQLDIEPVAIKLIAQRSRQTPRIANRLLKRVRDFVQVKKSNKITVDLTKQALALLEIDHIGLTKTDREILSTIIKKFHGGPVGLKTLSAVINMNKEILEEIHETFLIASNLLDRTPRGRVATKLAYQHLGISVPSSLNKKQQNFFKK